MSDTLEDIQRQLVANKDSQINALEFLNKMLKDQTKDLEEKLSLYEWKPADEAIEGREYDVCGGEYILADDHTCYPSWSSMGAMVKVATYKGIDYDGEPDFEGEYGECYNSEYHYKPKWIRERPTPPSTQEGEE